MKPLAIWLAIVAVVFGVYAAVTVALQETERVLVVVDASQSMAELETEKKLEVVEGAGHLFEEPGALDEVARLTREWFQRHLAS